MNRKSLHWLLVATNALAIGSIIAFTEKFLSFTIDASLPDISKISNYSRPGTITLLSTNQSVIQKLGPATREKVDRGMMPTLIKNAFISSEDRRFFKHKGVDFFGISRALITNFIQRDIREGGSTITQQLARTVFLNQDKTLKRKLKEAALAFKIERQFSKEEILEKYLNNVYLGSGAYGISDAAWVYFSKTPSALSLEEAALIAGLTPAPSIYSPLVNPKLALRQRSIVLEKMALEGFISEKDLSESIKSPLILKPATPKYFNSAAPFFTSWLFQELPKFLTKEQLELGGLTIQTSLNLDWQKKAQKIIKNTSLKKSEAAIVSIQPSTGLVRVLIGGKDFQKTQFNRATQALRSPGSTFKIFPYAAAIEEGMSPDKFFIDQPQCWNDYCPKNFGNLYMGKISMADAFSKSLNTIAVKLLEEVGFEKVISTANNFGIGNERKLKNYYPLAIGAFEQTVLEMTGAYAAITNRGIYMKPVPFEQIIGPNQLVLWNLQKNGSPGKKAIKAKTADTMNWMLQKVVQTGTGIAASLEDRPVAGKTGTSEKNRDLWFIGSIPQLTTGVWFGNDNNKPTKLGSGEAAWAWKQFMIQIKDEFQILNFPEK